MSWITEEDVKILDAHRDLRIKLDQEIKQKRSRFLSYLDELKEELSERNRKKAELDAGLIIGTLIFEEEAKYE